MNGGTIAEQAGRYHGMAFDETPNVTRNVGWPPRQFSAAVSRISNELAPVTPPFNMRSPVAGQGNDSIISTREMLDVCDVPDPTEFRARAAPSADSLQIRSLTQPRAAHVLMERGTSSDWCELIPDTVSALYRETVCAKNAVSGARPGCEEHVAVSLDTPSKMDEGIEPTLRKISLAAYELPDTPGLRAMFQRRFYEHRGLDQAYVTLRPNPQQMWEEQERESFFCQRDRLAADARQFFDRVAVPRAAVKLSVDPSFTDKQIFEAMYREKNGIVLGEDHDSRASKKLVMDNMHCLKELGVATLYLEHVCTDLHQAALTDYFSTSGEGLPMQEHLKTFLDYLDRKNLIEQDKPYSFRKLVEKARDVGIKVIAIDCLASYRVRDMCDPRIRLKVMPYFASAKIAQYQSASGSARWLAFVGSSHTNRIPKAPEIVELSDEIGGGRTFDASRKGLGVAELTDGIGVRLTSAGSRPFFEEDRGVIYMQERQLIRADYHWNHPMEDAVSSGAND